MASGRFCEVVGGVIDWWTDWSKGVDVWLFFPDIIFVFFSLLLGMGST